MSKNTYFKDRPREAEAKKDEKRPVNESSVKLANLMELNPNISQEDEENHWWIAGEKDDFNLQKKLLRVGCHPILKKYILCSQDRETEYLAACQKNKVSLEDCQSLLQITVDEAKRQADKLSSLQQ